MDILHQIGQPLILVLVPLIVAFLKTKVLPTVPPLLLPVLAAVIGPLLDLLLAFLAAKAADPAKGAIYALAGIGLREIVDQGKKAISG